MSFVNCLANRDDKITGTIFFQFFILRQRQNFYKYNFMPACKFS